MRQPTEYAYEADKAYEEYVRLQERIDRIEASAKEKHGNAADYRLATDTEYWKYRQLCVLRNVKIEVCRINAGMVGVAKEFLRDSVKQLIEQRKGE